MRKGLVSMTQLRIANFVARTGGANLRDFFQLLLGASVRHTDGIWATRGLKPEPVLQPGCQRLRRCKPTTNWGGGGKWGRPCRFPIARRGEQVCGPCPLHRAGRSGSPRKASFVRQFTRGCRYTGPCRRSGPRYRAGNPVPRCRGPGPRRAAVPQAGRPGAGAVVFLPSMSLPDLVKPRQAWRWRGNGNPGCADVPRPWATVWNAFGVAESASVSEIPTYLGEAEAAGTTLPIFIVEKGGIAAPSPPLTLGIAGSLRHEFHSAWT